MRPAALLALLALVACGAPPPATPATPPTAIRTAGAPTRSACSIAYAEYEAAWREARTDELQEFTAGDPDILEEVLFYELATVPTRSEVSRMREIYAVIEAFLWNAPWPRALAAADVAIDRCGEKTARPSS